MKTQKMYILLHEDGRILLRKRVVDSNMVQNHLHGWCEIVPNEANGKAFKRAAEFCAYGVDYGVE